jgi:hypothetical protein
MFRLRMKPATALLQLRRVRRKTNPPDHALYLRPAVARVHPARKARQTWADRKGGPFGSEADPRPIRQND